MSKRDPLTQARKILEDAAKGATGNLFKIGSYWVAHIIDVIGNDCSYHHRRAVEAARIVAAMWKAGLAEAGRNPRAWKGRKK